MSDPTVTQINVSALQDLPVQTKNTSSKLARIIYKAAKSNPDTIPPILVGRVNQMLYPINDFETVVGLRRSKLQQIKVLITDYSTMQDLIVAHVKTNFQPHMIDPFRLRQVIDYMTKDGITQQEACELLWLDKRPELFKVIRCEISDDARRVILEMIDEISEKIYSVVTPIYYVTMLSKIDKKEQYDASLAMKSMTTTKIVSEAKFSWPLADVVQSLLSEFPKYKKILSTEERTVNYDDDDVDDLPKKKKSKIAKKSPDAKTVKKADKYLRTDPNLVYASLNGKHPDLLFHKKTGRVAIVEEKNGTYAMTDNLGKSTYVIGDNIVKFLDLDNIERLHVVKYTTTEKARQALAKVKKPSRCVILSPVNLPRS